MQHNPYSAPDAAPIADQVPVLAKAPDDVLRKIKVGWVVAGLSAAINLVAALLALKDGNAAIGIANAIGAALIGALAYGIYRKSRVAASLMLAYYTLVRVATVAAGSLDGAVIGVIVILVYLSAARATFQYHRWLQQERRFPSSQRPRLSDDPLFRTPPRPMAAAAGQANQDAPIPPTT